MNQQRIASLLGFAQKARKLVSGEVAVEQTVKSGKAKLLLVAADASENTKKSYQDMAANYRVNYHEVLSKEQIGACIGKPRRAALAITDAGFAKALGEELLS